MTNKKASAPSAPSASSSRPQCPSRPPIMPNMDDLEIVLSYLFEMWTTGQDASLTYDDLDLLMEYLQRPTTMTDQEQLLQDFMDAAAKLFEWYDGDRSIITHLGYTCPTTIGAHGMTLLRTAIQNAEKLEKVKR